MRNNALRAIFKPRAFDFWASVLTITPPRLPDVITISTLTCLSDPERSVKTTCPSGIVRLLNCLRHFTIYNGKLSVCTSVLSDGASYRFPGMLITHCLTLLFLLSHAPK